MRVKDINPGISSNTVSLTNVNGTLYFSAIDGKSGFELWKSDGTDAQKAWASNIDTNDTSERVDQRERASNHAATNRFQLAL